MYCVRRSICRAGDGSAAQSRIAFFYKRDIVVLVGRGGALVELMPFDRRVAGSNPALGAT